MGGGREAVELCPIGFYFAPGLIGLKLYKSWIRITFGVSLVGLVVYSRECFLI